MKKIKNTDYSCPTLCLNRDITEQLDFAVFICGITQRIYYKTRNSIIDAINCFSIYPLIEVSNNTALLNFLNLHM